MTCSPAQRATDAAEWSPRDVIARALAGVAETKQAWTRSALMRAVSDALPGNLRIGPDDVRRLLDGLTDAALDQAVPVTEPADTRNLPESELLANGQPPYTAPAVQLFTTHGQVSAEHALRTAAVVRGAAAFTPEEAGEIRRHRRGHVCRRVRAAGVTAVTNTAAWLGARGLEDQPAGTGSEVSRVNAAASSRAHGQERWIRSRVRRAGSAICGGRRAARGADPGGTVPHRPCDRAGPASALNCVELRQMPSR